MRYLIVALLCVGLFTSCNNNKTTAESNTQPISGDTTDLYPSSRPSAIAPTSLAVHFPQLFEYFATQDAAFAPTAFDTLAAEKDTTAWQLLDSALLSDFRPYFVFNADSSLAIDYVSANYVLRKKGGKSEIVTGGPDTEVALMDVKNNRRKRLLFLGTMGYVCEAKWQDANTLLIAGAEEAGSGMIPVLWKYSIPESTMQQLRYKTPLDIEVRDYAEKALNQQR